MKKKIALLALAAAAFLPTACERHKWDETKQLFKEGEQASGGDHGKASEHGDKKKEDAPKH